MDETAPPSPLAAPDAWNLVAPAYADEITPLFEVFAQEAIRLAGVAKGSNVVDVACGPGTLSFLAARAGAKVSALDFSATMIERLLARLEREGTAGIDARVGDGMALPYADASFDAGFSMFGLMFFPDRHRGFSELARVIQPGAKAVVSSWVDFQRLPILSALFGELGELVPQPNAPRRPMALIDPETCIAEMSAGGFADVEVRELTGGSAFATTDGMLDFFIRTSAPVVLMKRGFGDAWPALEAKWRARVNGRIGAGPHESPMPAYLIVGTRR